MEDHDQTDEVSFLKPALIFLPTVIIILIIVGVLKSRVGLSSGAGSIILNIVIVGGVTYFVIRKIVREVKRPFTTKEKIRFVVLSALPLTALQSVFVLLFVGQSSALFWLLVPLMTMFFNFCGVWLVISTMFQKIFEKELNAA